MSRRYAVRNSILSRGSHELPYPHRKFHSSNRTKRRYRTPHYVRLPDRIIPTGASVHRYETMWRKSPPSSRFTTSNTILANLSSFFPNSTSSKSKPRGFTVGVSLLRGTRGGVERRLRVLPSKSSGPVNFVPRQCRVRMRTSQPRLVHGSEFALSVFALFASAVPATTLR